MSSITNTLPVSTSFCPGAAPIQSSGNGVPRRRSGGPFFEGISTWPCLDQLLQDKAIALIRHQGIKDWELAGGIKRLNGKPSLGQPSIEAFRLLRDILDTQQGFWFCDDASVHWAVIVPPSAVPDPTSWTGIALGFEFSPAFAVPSIRRQELSELEAQLQRNAPQARTLGPGIQAIQTRDELTYRRLQLLDHGLKLIPLLHAAAPDPTTGAVHLDPVRLGRVLWRKQQPAWPTEWRETVFEAVVRLDSIHTQELQLAKTGWHPVAQQCGRAVQSVCKLSSGKYSVRVDPIFSRFLDH